MKVKSELVMSGPGPSEQVVKVQTADGSAEEVIVHQSSFANGYLETSVPLMQDGDRVLVELPRESVSGRWRLWVNKSRMIG